MKPQTAVQRAMQAHFGAAEQAPGVGFVAGFEAGWNAAVTHMLDILEVPTNVNAPAEAATSDRRSENITDSSISNQEDNVNV